MSSPISRDNRLEGHELYAPRSVREKWSEDQTALGLKPDARENDQLQASGSDPWYARPQAADARAVGDDDIREVIDVEPTAPADLDFQPAPAISSQDETGWPPASFDGRLRERVPVQAAARRSFLLDPDIVPDPPIARRGFPAIGLLARFSLMVGVAAAIACGVTMMSSSKPDDGWMKRAGGSTAAFGPTFHAAQSEPQAASRLVADDQQTFTNDPLPLGIAVDHEKGNESPGARRPCGGYAVVSGRAYRRVRLAIGAQRASRLVSLRAYRLCRGDEYRHHSARPRQAAVGQSCSPPHMGR